jgi:hypothetical protein
LDSRLDPLEIDDTSFQPGKAPLPANMPSAPDGAILTRSLQLLLGSVAASSFAWALCDPRFRDAEGFLQIEADIGLVPEGERVLRERLSGLGYV